MERKRHNGMLIIKNPQQRCWEDGNLGTTDTQHCLKKHCWSQDKYVLWSARDVGGIVGEDAGGGRTGAQTDNPFDFNTVKQNIIAGLFDAGFTHNDEYIIMPLLDYRSCW